MHPGVNFNNGSNLSEIERPISRSNNCEFKPIPICLQLILNTGHMPQVSMRQHPIMSLSSTEQKLVPMELKVQQRMPRVRPVIAQSMLLGNAIYKIGPNPRIGERILVKMLSPQKRCVAAFIICHPVHFGTNRHPVVQIS
jgi:hypothetical protein